jgi:hypothetical protein
VAIESATVKGPNAGLHATGAALIGPSLFVSRSAKTKQR